MLNDESRLAAMAQLLACQRRRRETINGTLARYAAVRPRAAREGRCAIRWEGCAFQLLRASNASLLFQQLLPCLQGLYGRLFLYEAEFARLRARLRIESRCAPLSRRPPFATYLAHLA